MDLSRLGTLYASQGRYADAQPVLERALAIEAESRWSQTPQVLKGLSRLAAQAHVEGRRDEAEALYAWALEVSERTLGREDVSSATLRTQYAAYLRALGRDEEADALEGG
jgi:tetratricopeptide (TPR) repeat protein